MTGEVVFSHNSHVDEESGQKLILCVCVGGGDDLKHDHLVSREGEKEREGGGGGGRVSNID